MIEESLLVQGGRVLDPASGRDEVADVRIVEGRVAEIGSLRPHTGESVLPAQGLVVTPGLVDLCVHLREPGFEDKETIRSGAQAAVAGGFTAIAAMPDTDEPPEPGSPRWNAGRLSALKPPWVAGRQNPTQVDPKFGSNPAAR